MINKNSKIFVAGHKGMVGSAILRTLKKKNFSKVFTIKKKKLNLLNQTKVKKYFLSNKFDAVIIAAAKVGGILDNQSNKPEYLYENLTIQNNIIHFSYISGVKNLIFLGSSCIYPRNCIQFLDAYALAKITGVKMCEYYSKKYNLNYKTLMPSNLYGINDSYDISKCHFFSALIKKIYIAKKYNHKNITLYGDGRAMRELTFADDIAEACIFFLKKKTKYFLINIGSKKEKSIKGYANFIMKKFKIKLKIIYDKSKPNGTPRKIVDNGIAKKLGFKKYTSLDKGFEKTLKDFKKNFIK
jgi:GDP-L-fucose synthase